MSWLSLGAHWCTRIKMERSRNARSWKETNISCFTDSSGAALSFHFSEWMVPLWGISKYGEARPWRWIETDMLICMKVPICGPFLRIHWLMTPTRGLNQNLNCSIAQFPGRFLDFRILLYFNPVKFLLLLLLLLGRFSHVRLCATPWTAAYQAPPSMGFSRQEYWSGCHCLLR